MTEAAEEKLPISEFYKVVEYVTIFKSQKMVGGSRYF